MVKHIYYLDAPLELATQFILQQRGVQVVREQVVAENRLASVGSGFDTSVEHKFNVDIVIHNVAGVTAVDVKDSADCWIRVILEVGDYLLVPASVFRKVYHQSGDSTSVVYAPSDAIYLPRYLQSADANEVISYHNYRELVCELCRQFFDAGWVTGTGGSISIRHGNRIYMTPSGVQKERIMPDELYVLDVEGSVLSIPSRKPGCRLPKLSDCSPLFLHAFQQRNAGAVLHSHAYCCNIVTSMFEGKSEFRISHQEMIKGINGYGYYDELAIPIIENTAWEHELADSLGEAIRLNPKAVAVLVRRHGMYVWGDTWEQAKRHGECLHYLFDIAIEMHKMGLDYTRGPLIAVQVGTKRKAIDDADHAQTSGSYKHVVFDVEGTTTPITFVKDVLFPFSVTHCSWYFETTWSSQQTQSDVSALVAQNASDLADSALAAPTVVGSDANRAAFVASLSSYVAWCVEKDRKVAALKTLQGHIWEVGYNSGDIKSVVYDDVPRCFSRLAANNVQTSIYSSGSREAQRLLFKYSNFGDLRTYIACYFDTKVGMKREKESYLEIARSLGVDSPSDILFVTDIYEEAVAADSAGLQVVISNRPGNAVLPANNPFKVVTTFDSL